MSRTHLQTAHEYGIKTALAKCGYADVSSVQADAEALGLVEKTAAPFGITGLGPLGKILAGTAGGGLVGGGIGALRGEEGNRGETALHDALVGMGIGGAGGLGAVYGPGVLEAVQAAGGPGGVARGAAEAIGGAASRAGGAVRDAGAAVGGAASRAGGAVRDAAKGIPDSLRNLVDRVRGIGHDFPPQGE